jgi:hypothetical protein
LLIVNKPSLKAAGTTAQPTYLRCALKDDHLFRELREDFPPLENAVNRTDLVGFYRNKVWENGVVRGTCTEIAVQRGRLECGISEIVTG